MSSSDTSKTVRQINPACGATVDNYWCLVCNIRVKGILSRGTTHFSSIFCYKIGISCNSLVTHLEKLEINYTCVCFTSILTATVLAQLSEHPLHAL